MAFFALTLLSDPPLRSGGASPVHCRQQDRPSSPAARPQCHARASVKSLQLFALHSLQKGNRFPPLFSQNLCPEFSVHIVLIHLNTFYYYYWFFSLVKGL